jgi:prepilin peptidase CpaA
MSTMLSMALLALLVPALLIAVWSDLRSRTIPNGLTIAIALCAIPFWWATGLSFWPEAALQIGLAALVFASFAVAFAIGAMGGGDVKLLGALALWLPWPSLLVMLVVMSIAGGALTLVMLVRHRFAGNGAKKGSKDGGPLEIPYGVAIAVGGLWVVSERFLYQFG